jgi:hypothetical protein
MRNAAGGGRFRGGRCRRSSGTAVGVWAVCAIALAAASGCSDAPSGSSDHAWLELGPGGERIARVVTADTTCPTLDVDGRTVTMQVRALPDPPMFPVLTCEATVPAEADRAAIGGAVLPLPRVTTGRIAVIGDTGCRIENGHVSQACNDATAWPFAGLAHAVAELVDWLTGSPEHGDFESLARSIAALDPDLIVHVGDYLYRESPCPAGDAGCAGSPYGYNWETIEADFFAPAEPLFRSAPLALTRGNHESCNRAGAVWFRFLDPRPYDPDCVNYTEPYAIEIGGLQLLMLDSSDASDTSVDPAQVAVYRQQLEEMGRLAGPRSFVVTHRPFWVFGHAGEMDGKEVLFEDNPTLQAASENQLPPGVEAVLSGHVHLFQLLGFDAARVPQLVVGNSGTGLDHAVTTPLAGLEIAGATVAVGETLDQFGFTTMEPEGSGWHLTVRDMAGAVQRECTIAGTQVRCP